MGFSGYYNPFSGEAQVNTTIPRFVQPFTTCHEIGHQLGYAKEEEANFSGFLATKSSNDPAFRYSVYVDLYLYSASALYALDSTAFIPYRESLHPDVRQDLRDLKAFYRKYQNPFEPVIHALYGKYLKANRQPQGIYSYDEVVGLAIAYYQKYGAEAFLKFILPHHTFNRFVGLPAVFCIFFLIVFHFNFTVDREINQLADRHSFVNSNRLFY